MPGHRISSIPNIVWNFVCGGEFYLWRDWKKKQKLIRILFGGSAARMCTRDTITNGTKWCWSGKSWLFPRRNVLESVKFFNEKPRWSRGPQDISPVILASHTVVLEMPRNFLQHCWQFISTWQPPTKAFFLMLTTQLYVSDHGTVSKLKIHPLCITTCSNMINGPECREEERTASLFRYTSIWG